MQRYIVILGVMVAAIHVLGGCKKDESASAQSGSQELKPREVGTFRDTGPSPATRPAGMSAAPGTLTGTPTATMPNDAVHAPFLPGANLVPQFKPPTDWQARPARGMTDQIFALARAEGDAEDADLAVSHLRQHISMQDNLARWADMFGYQGAAIEQHCKQQELQGVSFPTTLVDISGTYQGSMMAPANPPKADYRMLVAEIRTPQRPYYVRLTGPQKTVAKWEEAYLKFVREAAK